MRAPLLQRIFLVLQLCRTINWNLLKACSVLLRNLWELLRALSKALEYRKEATFTVVPFSYQSMIIRTIERLNLINSSSDLVHWWFSEFTKDNKQSSLTRIESSRVNSTTVTEAELCGFESFVRLTIRLFIARHSKQNSYFKYSVRSPQTRDSKSLIRS